MLDRLLCNNAGLQACKVSSNCLCTGMSVWVILSAANHIMLAVGALVHRVNYVVKILA